LHEVLAPLLTVRQVAERLGVCTATVYTLVERGELKHVRVSNAIRVAPGELVVFIRAKTKASKRQSADRVPSEGQ
jgi:excisionase family DNA binding protein